MKTCETCMFFAAFERDPGFSREKLVQLIAKAPTIINPTAFTDGTCRIRSPFSNCFPLRMLDDWCGEHQPKEESK